MKEKPVIWKIVLLNLAEAHGDLLSLQRRLVYLDTGMVPECDKDIIEYDVRKKYLRPEILAGQLEHIYHHVNWAWNCRHADEARAIRCEHGDFRRWEKFPMDWPELWLPPSRRRNVVSKWPYSAYWWRSLEHVKAMRIAIDEAEYTLDHLIDCVMMRLGDNLPNGWKKPECFPKNVVPVTEADFADSMRHLYMKLNEAWNSRRLNLAGKIPCSRQYFRCLFCFPRAFTDFWPKSMLAKKTRGEKNEHVVKV